VRKRSARGQGRKGAGERLNPHLIEQRPQSPRQGRPSGSCDQPRADGIPGSAGESRIAGERLYLHLPLRTDRSWNRKILWLRDRT